PAHWSSFNNAIEAAMDPAKKFNGIGFVFAGDYTGVDLDHALEGQGQAFKPWAREILENCRTTYCELSPSRTGAHILFRGALPQGWKGTSHKYHDGKVEIYSVGRYFTVTGYSLSGASSAIADQSPYVLELYKRINAGTKNGSG